MAIKLQPTWYSKDIYSVDLEKLQENNIKYIFSDLDNTLVGYDVAIPNEKVFDLLNNLKKYNLELILISNNNFKRLSKFCNSSCIRFISGARKPGCKKINQFLINNSINKDECVLIGDQLLTDMWCANKANIKCILVEPLQKKESKFTFFNRRMDRIIRKRYAKKDILKSIMREE